jgi:nitroreductase
MTDKAAHPYLELIRKRVSVERFQAGRELSETEIRTLVEDAIEAPSSFNIQHCGGDLHLFGRSARPRRRRGASHAWLWTRSWPSTTRALEKRCQEPFLHLRITEH